MPYNNKSTLIGTDGNDTFDASYYAAYPQYFNISLLTSFLAGAGDDAFGGSANTDNLWGRATTPPTATPGRFTETRAANDSAFEEMRMAA